MKSPLRSLRFRLSRRFARKCILVFLAVPLLFIEFGLLSAQTGEEYEYPLKAQFIERFIHFVEWPDRSDENADTDRDRFVIGVFGASPITRHLDNLVKGKTLNKRPARVVAITDLKRISECDVLFIPAGVKRRLGEILSTSENMPLLTVGDTEGFGLQGVLINFYQDGEFLRFEINRTAVETSGLRFRSNLLRLARIVGEGKGK